jgi:hypothetical protein
MESSATAKQTRVKSWFGLTIGLVGVVASLGAAVQTGRAAHLLSAVGFACLTIVWSKIPLSFTTPLRKVFANAPSLSRGDAILMWTGFALVGISMALRWLL